MSDSSSRLSNYMRLCLVCLSLWVLSSCARPAEPPITLTLDPNNQGTHQLTLTTNQARDTTSTARNGTYTIQVITTPTDTWTIVNSSGTLRPDWMTTVADQAVFVTISGTRWFVDNDCLRDASGFPAINMRDVLGPLPGFTEDAKQPGFLASSEGSSAWSRFQAQAHITEDIMTDMDGSGRGRILLPFSEVIQGDITWQYRWTPAIETPIKPRQRCSDVLLDSLALPTQWQNRRFYGGSLLAESSDAPDIATQHVMTTLSETDWQLESIPLESTRYSLKGTRNNDTIQLFLVANTTGGTDITIITTTP